MKIALWCTASLMIAVLLTGAIGYAPTLSNWGAAGIRSMMVVGLTCLVASVAALIPVIIVAPRWPNQLGPAILAGSGVRLFVTIAVLACYQLLAHPHMSSFLFWATVFYLVVLAIDTSFGVVVIRRSYPTTKQIEGQAA